MNLNNWVELKRINKIFVTVKFKWNGKSAEGPEVVVDDDVDDDDDDDDDAAADDDDDDNIKNNDDGDKFESHR